MIPLEAGGSRPPNSLPPSPLPSSLSRPCPSPQWRSQKVSSPSPPFPFPPLLLEVGPYIAARGSGGA